ncbi:Subtilase family protein [Micromonospora pattaloongensis]|uniref:Subtilase family protein n=1 Tax=Micromonospora pattaloongensis TaxID=405436 RepID=A0A1H3H6Q5_9ACTN|nr:S8 family serine peptidase [Micromonospora pattaloongensis]SDY10319.1 Subtilase family protein [Micromonospora pattaloongensis]
MSRRFTAGAVATAAALALVVTMPSGGATAAPARAAEYTVVAADGVSADAALAAITAAGGTVVSRTDGVGVFQVVSDRTDFAARAAASTALVGAAERKAIGYAPKARLDKVERENLKTAAKNKGSESRRAAKADPLDDKLWGLDMMRAKAARKIESGDRRVTVGVMDTGVDASNPDIAANFDWRLSKNFAKDLPDVDGPCEVEACLDPVGTDDNGHGTHVAGTIGAAANGFGLSGVAPNVSLVELKTGQDSGYFFLDSVVNALVYAADKGIDVVNMSFYVDPWAFNCLNNPADSAEEQAAQQATIKGMRRALEYAHARGVTLVGALGNNHEDLGAPRTDTSSPNYGGTPRPRPIDNNTCWDLPVEGPHVIGVSAIGPSGKKSDFSNYGVEQISVAAPGGWYRDGFGTASYMTDANMILSAYPVKVLKEEGLVDADGNITPDGEGAVFKECTKAGKCGYYTYLQGTSMASPHAAGVAALIVSRFGGPDFRRGGLTMSPDLVEHQLLRTAAERACPEPRLQTYTNEGRSAEFNAYCEGDENFNGFYGYGIVDAYAAVTSPLQPWKRP